MRAGLIIYAGSCGPSRDRQTVFISHVLSAKLKQEPGVVYLDVDTADRAEVWEKSGTKGHYPLVFVGDKFIGDYDHIIDLNEHDELTVTFAPYLF